MRVYKESKSGESSHVAILAGFPLISPPLITNRTCAVSIYLLPIAYLLPIYCLLPITYLLPIAYCLLPIAHSYKSHFFIFNLNRLV